MEASDASPGDSPIHSLTESSSSSHASRAEGTMARRPQSRLTADSEKKSGKRSSFEVAYAVKNLHRRGRHR